MVDWLQSLCSQPWSYTISHRPWAVCHRSYDLHRTYHCPGQGSQDTCYLRLEHVGEQPRRWLSPTHCSSLHRTWEKLVSGTTHMPRNSAEHIKEQTFQKKNSPQRKLMAGLGRKKWLVLADYRSIYFWVKNGRLHLFAHWAHQPDLLSKTRSSNQGSAAFEGTTPGPCHGIGESRFRELSESFHHEWQSTAGTTERQELFWPSTLESRRPKFKSQLPHWRVTCFSFSFFI